MDVTIKARDVNNETEVKMAETMQTVIDITMKDCGAKLVQEEMEILCNEICQKHHSYYCIEHCLVPELAKRVSQRLLEDFVEGLKSIRVLLQNLEPQYKKLALEKLRIYHLEKGDQVEDYAPLDPRMGYQIPMESMGADVIYCSSIFDFTDKKMADPRAICGGSGFDDYDSDPYKITRLPEEVEKVNVHMNWDYTTIGCIRKCAWCIQWKREGNIVIPIKDVYDIWDGRSREITLMDNNILAVPDHFRKIAEQLMREKLKVDFNQGLDIRLVTDEFAEILSGLRHNEYHFAFDTTSIESTVYEKVELLRKHGIKRAVFCVLVEFDGSMMDDARRVMILKKLNQRVCAMKFKRQMHYIPFCRWANNKAWFKAMTFKEFVSWPENSHYFRDPGYRIKEWIDIFEEVQSC